VLNVDYQLWTKLVFHFPTGSDTWSSFRQRYEEKPRLNLPQGGLNQQKGKYYLARIFYKSRRISFNHLIYWGYANNASLEAETKPPIGVSSPTQLRFPLNAGFTIRAEFNGGAMSSDFGAFLLRGTNLKIDLIPRWVSAIYGHPNRNHNRHRRLSVST